MLAAIVAGRYSSAWNSLALGLCKDDGYRLMLSPKEESINRTDAFAQTLVQTVYQGCDWGVVMTLIEYSTGAMPTIISPWGPFGTLGTIATLGTDQGKAFVMTSTAGTPAAAAPATLTSLLAKLSPQANVELSFTSAARSVPVRLDLLPYDSAGTIYHFTTT